MNHLFSLLGHQNAFFRHMAIDKLSNDLIISDNESFNKFLNLLYNSICYNENWDTRVSASKVLSNIHAKFIETNDLIDENKQAVNGGWTSLAKYQPINNINDLLKIDNIILDDNINNRISPNMANSNNDNDEYLNSDEFKNLNIRKRKLAQKKLKKRKSIKLDTNSQSKCKNIINFNESLPDVNWCLSRFVDILIEQLSSRFWITRHGASIGLRAIISNEEHMKNSILNKQRWIYSAYFKVIHVILYDRFADYSGFKMVAPIRDVLAQICTLLAIYSSKAFHTNFNQCILDVKHIINLSDWNKRYAGYLILLNHTKAYFNYYMKDEPELGLLILGISNQGLNDNNSEVKSKAINYYYIFSKLYVQIRSFTYY